MIMIPDMKDTDSLYSDKGELYAKKLSNFVEKRLKPERAASVITLINSLSHSELPYLF